MPVPQRRSRADAFLALAGDDISTVTFYSDDCGIGFVRPVALQIMGRDLGAAIAEKLAQSRFIKVMSAA